MIIRQLSQEKYEYLKMQLIRKAQQNPLEASYNVKMLVGKREYVLKVQPDKKCKIIALQALEVERDELGHLHVLITDNKILSALLELLIWQGLA